MNRSQRFMNVPLVLISIVWSMTLVASIAAGESGGYLQAGLIVTVQPPGTPNHRVTPPISGETVGLAAAGGVFVTPRLAIEGEVVAGNAISTPQHFHYDWTEDYTAQSRDVFLGANVRWRPVAHLELIGGGGLAFNTFANRSIVRTDFFPVTHTTQPDQVETVSQPALNGGIAVPLPVSSRIEVVPAFTIRWVMRSDHGLGAYAGIGNWAYQFGGTVRFKLD